LFQFVEDAQLIHDGVHSLVYRARFPSGDPVVVKLMRPDYPSPRHLAAARREHAILDSIACDSVVETYGLRRQGHRLALLVEDFGGVGLDQLLTAGEPLALDRFFSVALSLAEALIATHAAGVVHKDIKPANIVVQPTTWVAKLIDFNISSVLAEQPQQAVHPHKLEGSLGCDRT
jgi:serine/threonine protein kinase